MVYHHGQTQQRLRLEMAASDERVRGHESVFLDEIRVLPLVAASCDSTESLRASWGASDPVLAESW